MYLLLTVLWHIQYRAQKKCSTHHLQGKPQNEMMRKSQHLLQGLHKTADRIGGLDYPPYQSFFLSSEISLINVSTS